MEQAAKLARLGDRLVSFLAGGLILLMLLYGGYSLWDTAMVYNGAFLSDELMAFKPSAENPDSNPTLSELQQINPDTRAWLTIYDTFIDYPVVQGESDWDYINTDIYGEFSLSGSIFLDSRNSPDFSDAYNLVYGHHMDNGGMFGDVVEFVNASYFQAHPTGRLYLPDATYDITLFACVQTDAFDSVIYNPTAQPDGSWLYTLPRFAGQGLRLDLADTAGVAVELTAIVLNERLPWQEYFVPSAWQLFWLAVLPGLAGCALTLKREKGEDD